jgi:hypothetical protein
VREERDTGEVRVFSALDQADNWPLVDTEWLAALVISQLSVRAASPGVTGRPTRRGSPHHSSFRAPIAPSSAGND